MRRVALGAMLAAAATVTITSLLIAISTAHAASARCDCAPDKKLGRCTAEIRQESNWLTIKSNVPQCSQVIWYADEQPNITIVMDGTASQEWLGPTQKPALSIESCEVCTDQKYAHLGGAGGEYSGIDLSGTWQLFSDRLYSNGARTVFFMKQRLSRVSLNEYRVTNLEFHRREFLPPGRKWYGGACAGTQTSPCIYEKPAGQQGTLTVNETTATIVWTAPGWGYDTLRILGSNRMEGSASNGAALVYTK